jgi:hypothetical protein
LSVDSISGLKERVAADPNVEISMMAVVEVAWFPPSRHVGFVHFRRTWCNNLCVDFLNAHPDIVSNREPIKGVGTALLDFIISVAREIRAGEIWGETTSDSVRFYRKLLDDPKAADRFRIRRRSFGPLLRGFADRAWEPMMEKLDSTMGNTDTRNP